MKNNNILEYYDIIYEIIKYIDIHEIHKYKYITKSINCIINNIIYKKNKKYIYYMKNFIKPRLFKMALSFNNSYTYYYGLFIRLEPIILFIKENKFNCNDCKELTKTSTINDRIINIRFTLLKYTLEHDIAFKLMDITFDNINSKTNKIQYKINGIKQVKN